MSKGKMAIRILSVMITVFVLMAALTACSGGIPREEAQATTIALFDALSEGDYEEAASLFHPDTFTNAQNLSDYCAGLLKDYGIDVSKGMTIDKYTGFGSAFYDSNVGGSRYELTMKVIVGDKTCSFTTEIVKTDTGYGLTNLHYNP